MQRRCRHQPARKDPYAEDVARRLRGLLAIVLRQASRNPDAIRRDDELLNGL
ncbi:hypothetical protein ACWF0M_17730 [Kribbella sp. NPDC055110]